MKNPKKKTLVYFICCLWLISMLHSCSDNKKEAIIQVPVPTIKLDSTFAVSIEKDIIYAEGLSHRSINDSNYSILPLKLDVYLPEKGSKNKPVFMFIHGGGFERGSKEQNEIVRWGNYYASRGWVFVSINYRLKNDFGTVPQEWIDYSVNLPEKDVLQFLAMYPAHRDAKAAMRWIIEHGDKYDINKDYITVGGSSAGSITAITLGISDLEDYKIEIDSIQDPSLSTTNLKSTYKIKTIVDLWGSQVGIDPLKLIYNHQRFDRNDPPLFITHGTEDNILPISNALDLAAIYKANKIDYVYYPLEGEGHAAWNATFENKKLEELAFDFVVKQQNLNIESK